jgi:hypothetical protein
MGYRDHLQNAVHGLYEYRIDRSIRGISIRR